VGWGGKSEISEELCKLCVQRDLSPPIPFTLPKLPFLPDKSATNTKNTNAGTWTFEPFDVCRGDWLRNEASGGADKEERAPERTAFNQEGKCNLAGGMYS
jgi:hypothetical protein